MAKELLNLSTAEDVDHVVIDGDRYALADPGSFSTLQVVALRRKATALSTLELKTEITDDEASKADRNLAEIFAAVAPAVPEDIAARLTPWKKAMIVQAFFLRVAEIRAAAAMSSSSASPSSPASSASTAPAREPG